MRTCKSKTVSVAVIKQVSLWTTKIPLVPGTQIRCIKISRKNLRNPNPVLPCPGRNPKWILSHTQGLNYFRAPPHTPSFFPLHVSQVPWRLLKVSSGFKHPQSTNFPPFQQSLKKVSVRFFQLLLFIFTNAS